MPARGDAPRQEARQSALGEASGRAACVLMVCDDCTKQLSVISAPDPWKQGSSGCGPGRLVNENKLLRKGIRSNPYSNSCKICKLKCQQNNAVYCTICAYAKGLCSICGKVVQDTRMYKMSEGGNGWHTVKADRDEKSFKSPDQIAREESQTELLEFLANTGSVGRMPTRTIMEAAGKKELAATLARVYGGLFAAADAFGLSKRFLNEEADEKKEEKRRATLLAKQAHCARAPRHRAARPRRSRASRPRPTPARHARTPRPRPCATPTHARHARAPRTRHVAHAHSTRAHRQCRMQPRVRPQARGRRSIPLRVRRTSRLVCPQPPAQPRPRPPRRLRRRARQRRARRRARRLQHLQRLRSRGATSGSLTPTAASSTSSPRPPTTTARAASTSRTVSGSTRSARHRMNCRMFAPGTRLHVCRTMCRFGCGVTHRTVGTLFHNHQTHNTRTVASRAARRGQSHMRNRNCRFRPSPKTKR